MTPFFASFFKVFCGFALGLYTSLIILQLRTKKPPRPWVYIDDLNAKLAEHNLVAVVGDKSPNEATATNLPSQTPNL